MTRAVIVLAFLLALLAPTAEATLTQLPAATEVVVHKAQRRLELWQGSRLLRSYRISLGLNPVGHKQREGDFKTPEGRYILDMRNPRSEFFLSVRVSYPDSRDVARARKAGVAPGGAIMVHGLPNDPRWPPEHYAREDWTDGCIALNNADMMEFWKRILPGYPCGKADTCGKSITEHPLETSIVLPELVDARVAPRGALESLSQDEIEQLLSTGQGGLYPLFRQCALAVLNAGSDTDDAREIFDRYRDFDIRILRHAFGVKLEIRNAPATAFVDGRMIQGTKELLFAVLRDIVYTANEIVDSGRFDLARPQSITNAVFHILRNARLLDHKSRPNLIVCWGGHSINREEYGACADSTCAPAADLAP